MNNFSLPEKWSKTLIFTLGCLLTQFNSFAKTFNNTYPDIGRCQVFDENSAFSDMLEIDFASKIPLALMDIDLELTMTTATMTPTIYSTISVETVVTNNGSATATDIAIEVPISDLTEIVYSGGNEFTLSQGVFYAYGTEIWEVGNLAPGESAILTTNYFVLSQNSYLIFSEILHANETDIDSSPNNGVSPTPNEDDEAVLIFNGTVGNCELNATLLNVNCSMEGTPNDPSDDTWGFIINVTANNASSGWLWETPNGTYLNEYDEPTAFTNFPLTGAETLTLIIRDQLDTTCKTTLMVETPFPCDNGGNLADVELSMNSTSTAGAFAFVSFEITATNAGNTAANNLNIFVPLPDDVVLQGGNGFSVTAGTVTGFNNINWNLISLAPGQTETLIVNYFTFTEENITAYAQVQSMLGDDLDSTPGNGTPPVPNEDDEAAFTLGGIPNLPDLTISNLSQNLPTVLQLETDYPITFDLNNIGTTLAAGDFRVGMYLSLDENFDANTDILVGQILTGNIANTVPVNALIRVEDTTPSQDYFLLIVADDLGDISELDENNNTLSSGNTFGVFNANDGCTGLFVANSQAELEQFPQGCTTWAGSINLAGNITDLSPLSNLDSILGSFKFENCTIQDFSGISDLEYTNSVLFFPGNEMTDLNGFPMNLSFASFQVIGSPNLISLEGFPAPLTPDLVEDITIANNNLLSNLDGLSILSGDYSNARVTISSNDVLTSLGGLNNVSSFDWLTVDNNEALQSVVGLENLNSLNRLRLVFNPILSECCAVFNVLSNGVPDVDIQGNLSGCNSVQDILDNCDPNTCQMTVTILDIQCQNGNTPNGFSDDTFSARILVEGNAECLDTFLINGEAAGIFGSNSLFGEQVALGPFLIEEGDVTILITDLDGNNDIFLTLEAPPHCSNGFTPDQCGFEMTYDDIPGNFFNLVKQNAIETADGYAIELLQRTSDVGWYYDLDVDVAGFELSNVASTFVTGTTPPLNFDRTSDDNFYAYDILPGNGGITFFKITATDQIIWENTFTFTMGGTQFPAQPKEIFEVSDGIIFIIGDGFLDPKVWILKTDFDGNEIYNKFLLEEDISSQYKFEELAENGDFFLSRRNFDGIHFFSRVSADGVLIFDKEIVDNTQDSRIGGYKETDDGAFIYGTFAENLQVKLEKFDAFTGDRTWIINLNETFSPSGGPTLAIPKKVVATLDGGAVMGISITNTSSEHQSFEYGRVNANGNLVWSRTLPVTYNLDAVLAASDGGFLFAGQIDGSFGLLKMTADGIFNPPCTSPSCEVSVELLDVQCQNQGTLDDPTDDTFSAILRVNGNAQCVGSFLIDGNFGGSFGSTLTLGQFLISEGDRSIDISDSDGNGLISYVLEASEACSNGANPNECGFEKVYPPIPDLVNVLHKKVTETADGYDIEVFRNFPKTYFDLSVDLAGNELSNTNLPLATDVVRRLSDGNFIATFNVSATEQTISKTNASGVVIWEQTFTFDTGNPQGSPQIRDIIELSDGLAFLVMTNGPTDNSWILKTDDLGNEIYLKHLQEANGFLEYYFYELADNGDFIIFRHSSSRVGYLIRVSATGDLLYEEYVIGDLVTSRFGGFSETIDGNFIYASYRNQLSPELAKFDAFTGERVWTLPLQNIFSPDGPQISASEGDVVATTDGGAVLGYRISTSTTDGYEYGRVNAFGNLVWWKHLPEGFLLDATARTSDGGFLFTGSKEEDFALVKITSEGLLTPTCDISDQTDLTLTLNSDPIFVGSDAVTHTLTVTNESDIEATNVSVRFTQGNSFMESFESATAGSYDLNSDIWTVGTVAAGTSEILVLKEQFVDFDFAGQPSVTFFEIVSSNPGDSDSTPDNDNGAKTADEDDEVLVEILPNGLNLPHDLSVVLGTAASNLSVGQTFSFDFRLQSDGDYAVAGVVAQLDIPSSLQVNSTNTTQGVFDAMTGEWQAGHFLPLQSATLTLEATLLEDSQVTNIFGQVQSTDNTLFDFDSEPGNGICCTPNEDDEAVLTIETNGTIQKPDLTIENVALTVDQLGENFNVNFENKNIGISPSGNHLTRLIISEDEFFSNDDEILPVNYLMNQLLNSGEFIDISTPNIPLPSLAPGDYFLLIFTDFNNDIQESVESNNIISTPFSIPEPLGIDLELQITANNTNPAPFSFVSITLELLNNGTEDGTGIIVDMPLPNFLTFQGGNEYSASQGAYLPYGNRQWTVGNLNAGETATLTLNYFVLATDELVNVYAQVIAQTPLDFDSTPNNGTPSAVNEDDEAALFIEVSAQLALGSGEAFSWKAYPTGDFISSITWAHNKGADVATYIVEHSLDGQNFEPLLARKSSGKNNYQLYETYDFEPQTGDNFYRIRIEYHDGTIEFSETQVVHYLDVLDFSLFPNPANKFVKVNLENLLGYEDVQIEMYNNLGILVFEKGITEVFAPYYQLDLRDLQEGFYTVYLKIPNRRAVAKRLVVGRM